MAQRLLHPLLLVLLGSTAQAQVAVSLGPRVGANVTTARFADVSSTPDYHRMGTTSALFGGEAGLTGSIRFKHVALQPGVVYAQKGFSQHLENTYLFRTPRQTDIYDVRKRLNYLVFPVQLVFNQRATGRGVQAFIGAYWGRLLGAPKPIAITPIPPLQTAGWSVPL